MFLEWLDEALAAGARLAPACDELGLDARTVQRWRAAGVGDDGRHGPKTAPSNKLSALERRKVLAVATSPEYRDKSPKQIVPALADKGTYVASESTFYRVLREEQLMAHRGRARPPAAHARPELRATGPNQVWSWDITYLRSSVVGRFFYLYLFVDVWSRKIVAFDVHEEECSELASGVLRAALSAEQAAHLGLVVHSDNGGPMKGATLKATMEKLGVLPSYSRPRVSDDNPFSEALFRTLKYRPGYPRRPFENVQEAREWVAGFVAWYNHEHLHSGIGYVTPASRHEGHAESILEHRRAVYERAQQRVPQRWTGRATRAWNAPQEVLLNPSPDTRLSPAHATAA